MALETVEARSRCPGGATAAMLSLSSQRTLGVDDASLRSTTNIAPASNSAGPTPRNRSSSFKSDCLCAWRRSVQAVAAQSTVLIFCLPREFHAGIWPILLTGSQVRKRWNAMCARCRSTSPTLELEGSSRKNDNTRLEVACTARFNKCRGSSSVPH